MNKVEKVRVLDDVQNSDLTAARNEYHFRPPLLSGLLSPYLKDQRDLPMLYLQLNIILFLLLSVSLNFYVNLAGYPAYVCHLVGVLHVVLLAVFFFERFILMLHYSSHRSMYENNILQSLNSWWLAPFFGVPGGMYKIHHCIMHHIENNHELDISSTEIYQRDNLLHFFIYWVRFTMLIWIELPRFTLRTNRYDSFKNLATGAAIYVATLGFLYTCVSARATWWIFGMTYSICFVALSFGNWSQHIFVDPKNPESNHALTYICIDSPVNRTTFNDGYHILHHVNARLHWSEMPKVFHEQTAKHDEAGGLCFAGIHFFDVGILVMTGQLRKLASKYYVHCGPANTAPTVDAIEGKLRSWLKPMKPVSSAKKKL